MHRISYFAFFTSLLFLLSCTPSPTRPLETSLLIYRFDPPAFLEYNENFHLIKEIPFSIPPNCGLYNTFPAPIGQFLLIELNCPNGQTVLFLDTLPSLSTGVETDSVSQPVTSSDGHFLAWTSDGKSVYLKVDSLGSPQIIRAYTDGKQDILDIPQFTYDLAAKADSNDFIFALSRGLGYGSELYLAQRDGKDTQLLYADQYNYISYARFSPDEKQIAFIKTPDTQTPFTVGELWVVNADGSNPRKMADADSGHGYAANWSTDGTRIAFVVRENPEDENADRSSEALVSNIYVVDVNSGEITQVTNFTEGHVETPYWSPQGNTLAFNAVLNGRMKVHIADIDSVGGGFPNPEILPLETDSTCCPAWMRK